MTVLTVFVAAALGGAVAVDVGAVVVIAGLALALIAVVNGLRMLGNLTRFLRT